MAKAPATAKPVKKDVRRSLIFTICTGCASYGKQIGSTPSMASRTEHRPRDGYCQRPDTEECSVLTPRMVCKLLCNFDSSRMRPERPGQGCHSTQDRPSSMGAQQHLDVNSATPSEHFSAQRHYQTPRYLFTGPDGPTFPMVRP